MRRAEPGPIPPGAFGAVGASLALRQLAGARRDTVDLTQPSARSDIESRSISASSRPMIEVDAPGRYEVTLTNTGAIPHDVTFPDGTHQGDGRRQASPATVEVDVPAEGLTFICSIPGHAEAGMKGTIIGQGVGGNRAARTTTAARMPATDVAADPNAPAPLTYDATAPAALRRHSPRHRPGHRREGDDRRAGFVQKVWTFGGTGSRARSSGSRSATRSASTSRTRPPTSCRTRSTSTPARSPGTTR